MSGDSFAPLGVLWRSRTPSPRPERQVALRHPTAARIRAAMRLEERRRQRRGWLLGALLAGVVAAGTTAVVRGLARSAWRGAAAAPGATLPSAAPGDRFASWSAPRPVRGADAVARPSSSRREPRAACSGR